MPFKREAESWKNLQLKDLDSKDDSPVDGEEDCKDKDTHVANQDQSVSLTRRSEEEQQQAEHLQKPFVHSTQEILDLTFERLQQQVILQDPEHKSVDQHQLDQNEVSNSDEHHRDKEPSRHEVAIVEYAL